MKTIDEYEAEAIADIKMDIGKLDTHMSVIGTRIIKWSKYLYQEELLLSKADGALKELYRKMFHKYTYEVEELIERKNIDIYINADPEYIKYKVYYDKQKIKVNFIAEIIKTLEQQSFQCNNIIKFLIFQSGGNV